MTDTDPNPNPDPNPDEGIDLEELVGRVLDSRGITTERMSKLDSLDNLSGAIGDLFKEHVSGLGTNAPAFDQDGFTKSLGDLLDAKLAGMPGTKAEKKPALLAWLGLA